jgi:hypothetical protein
MEIFHSHLISPIKSRFIALIRDREGREGVKGDYTPQEKSLTTLMIIELASPLRDWRSEHGKRP